MNRTYRTVAALGAAAALTLGGLAPASAARWSHQDAVGDVMTATYTWEDLEQMADDEWAEPEYVVDPDNRNTDVTRVAVRHSTNRLGMRLSLRDIDARSGAALYFIRAGDRRYMAMQRLGREQGMPGLMLMRGNGKRVRCDGVRRSVDRATEQARLGIPRRCLGRPAWVRVGAGVVSWEDDGETMTDRFDDGLVEGEGVGDLLTMSPRIKRA